MQVPGYEIGDQVGQGGMAVVYRARQLSLDRLVALKVLSPRYADEPEFSARFLNEGRMLASVVHRNVITIHDVRAIDGVTYIAMELVDDGDLGERLRRGLDVEAVIRYTKDLALALEAAHSQGIIHRDLKPSNVLFRSDGTLLLSDFGIAKDMEEDSDLTAAGTTIGSPQYLSPEQARGRPVDARVDIYSLGILLYEMFTGQRPFRGETSIDTILMHVEKPIPALPRHVRQFQPVLERM